MVYGEALDFLKGVWVSLLAFLAEVLNYLTGRA